MNVVRGAVIAFIAALLIGPLAFLHFQTDELQPGKQTEIAALLRRLKDIDHRWDTEVLRRQTELDWGLSSIERSVGEMERIRRTLETELRQIGDDTLIQRFQPLKVALAEKAELIRRLDDLGGARRFIEQRADEAGITRALALVTAGPRIDSFAAAVEQRFEMAAQRNELNRTYLVHYSGALLILLAYLAARLLRSYRTIAEVNRALAAANETLEQRVDDRTRELTDALRNLQESEAQLIQSEKMASLGQMVAGVAHEINTPLAYAKNSLGAVADRLTDIGSALEEADKLIETLRDRNATEDALSAQFARAADQVSRLRRDRVVEDLGALSRDGLHGIQQIAELVTNLRNFTRLDRTQLTRFDVNDGLESSLAMARHLLKSIEVRKAFGDVPTIRCSPSQILQIFLNLIINAAQAVDRDNACITLRSRLEGTECVAVEIEDNGPGIPSDVLPKIFDPFFTTKDIGKGTGLGLSIAGKIAHQHGGRIEVASTLNKGSCFTVVLPIALPSDVALAA